MSDSHCAVSALKEVLEREAYDVVVHSGDHDCLPAVEALLRYAAAPVAAVTGNLDDSSVRERLLEAGVLVEARVAVLKGIRVAGVGGWSPSVDAERLRGAEFDLLVSHHPPLGVLDLTYAGVHAGSDAVRRLVEEKKPLLHTCGHIHEARGVGRLGGTVVVNAGPLARGYYAVVEVAGGSVKPMLRRLKR